MKNLYERVNAEAKWPFVKDGDVYYSYLCKVGDDPPHFPYYTFVYARTFLEALSILENEFSDCEVKEII